MPTAVRLTAFWDQCPTRRIESFELTLPHEGHAYRACWVISIFFTLGFSHVRFDGRGATHVFRSEAP